MSQLSGAMLACANNGDASRRRILHGGTLILIIVLSALFGLIEIGQLHLLPPGTVQRALYATGFGWLNLADRDWAASENGTQP